MPSDNLEGQPATPNDEMHTIPFKPATPFGYFFFEDIDLSSQWLQDHSLSTDLQRDSDHDPLQHADSFDFSAVNPETSLSDAFRDHMISIGRDPTLSNFCSPAGIMTANSPATFMSARSTFNSPAFMSARGYSPAVRINTIREDETPAPELSKPLIQLIDDYYSNLHQQNIIQSFDKELNWSGKGQHVTFTASDAVPLTYISHLGASNTATVDKVLCRRIALARKTMRCNRTWTVADALREVYHLQNLRHFHLIQLVGTYLQGRNFSILMYPAADMHLGRFLEDTNDMGWDESLPRKVFLTSSISCLASVMAFIHDRTTKHMDIKPQNILVRNVPGSLDCDEWRIYLADFGLSRTFASQDHSQTDGPTARTPRYCSPEVYNGEPRGRPADIFSLGCVFMEIMCILLDQDLQELADARRGDGDDESFHANLERAVDWAHKNLRPIGSDAKFPTFEELTEIVLSMISRDPTKRPTAMNICSLLQGHPLFPFNSCCSLPPEPYTAYRRSEETE